MYLSRTKARACSGRAALLLTDMHGARSVVGLLKYTASCGNTRMARYQKVRYWTISVANAGVSDMTT